MLLKPDLELYFNTSHDISVNNFNPKPDHHTLRFCSHLNVDNTKLPFTGGGATCPIYKQTQKIVIDYAYNIQSFFTGFTSAWQKMTESVPGTLLDIQGKNNAINTPTTSPIVSGAIKSPSILPTKASKKPNAAPVRTPSFNPSKTNVKPTTKPVKSTKAPR